MFRKMMGTIGQAVRRVAGKGEVGYSAEPDEAASEIDFHPLNPVAMQSPDVASFELMTEEWLRNRYDPALYELAARYVAKQRVTILHVNGTYIHAATRGASVYEQELSFHERRILGACTCADAPGRSSSGGSLLLCRHALAVLLFQVASNRAQTAVYQEACLCPVTRQELRPGDRIFQCQACHTAYSEAGWQFVRQTARGRCCTCGQAKTICPLH